MRDEWAHEGGWEVGAEEEREEALSEEAGEEGEGAAAPTLSLVEGCIVLQAAVPEELPPEWEGVYGEYTPPEPPRTPPRRWGGPPLVTPTPSGASLLRAGTANLRRGALGRGRALREAGGEQRDGLRAHECCLFKERKKNFCSLAPTCRRCVLIPF